MVFSDYCWREVGAAEVCLSKCNHGREDRLRIKHMRAVMNESLWLPERRRRLRHARARKQVHLRTHLGK